jgi:flagellar hook assembly protein FlgD
MKKMLAFAVIYYLLSVSCLFAQQKDDLVSVIVYPNPVRTAIGQNQVTFENLTGDVTIRIFKISGGLVRQIESSDSGGTVTWDLTNDNGEKVGSAVYLYLITNSAGQKAKGKLAIIR